MSANIKLLKTRIKSVDSTLHLTRAMQLVAASKIRKATEKLAASRSYLDAFGTVMAQLPRPFSNREAAKEQFSSLLQVTEVSQAAITQAHFARRRKRFLRPATMKTPVVTT